MLGDAGHRRGVGDAARGVDQGVVGEGERTVGRGGVHGPRLGVEAVHPGDDESDARPRQRLGQGVHGGGLPRGDLVHPDTFDEVAVGVDDGHLDLVGSGARGRRADRGESRVPRSDDHDPVSVHPGSPLGTRPVRGFAS